MPLSKSMSKIQKNMKGSGKKMVHPKGRRFQQLTRATLREQKVEEKKRAHNEKRSNELARVKFIQDVINSESFKFQKSFSLDETAVFIEQFVNRDDAELEVFRKKQRSNRPTPNRQLLLEQKKKLELEEFEKGFLCPDLSDEQSVVFLRNWNGSFGALRSFKMIRVNREGKQVVGGHNSFSVSAPQADVNMAE
ncbi:Translation machinery-associated protein 16 [Nakaseomyces bracarensis]|uniref:Translation machinery-associated protein 16 n=1 Tax=Nakaseomyces bracarensis TaxID=273131 RepID=A0ABR4NVD9_9SACH